MKEYVYATFGGAEMDSVVCNIFCDGISIGGGPMTFANKIYSFEFTVPKAGSYFCLCEGTKAGKKDYRDFSFTVFEDAVPQYVNIDSILFGLEQIKSKLGKDDKNTIDGLMQQLISYETGVTPLPFLYPITALNSKLCFCEGNNSMILSKTGEGVTGAKVMFKNKGTQEEYICYTTFGYWGFYLPVGSYSVTISYNNSVYTEDFIVG